MILSQVISFYFMSKILATKKEKENDKEEEEEEDEEAQEQEEIPELKKLRKEGFMDSSNSLFWSKFIQDSSPLNKSLIIFTPKIVCYYRNGY